jgi:hypothetical protein
MKFLSSIGVAAGILFCANSSHACPGGEAGSTGYTADNIITVAQHTDAHLAGSEEGQAATAAPHSYTLLDHEGDSSDSSDPNDWIAAIAELKTDWDLTGMVGVPVSSSDYDIPRRRFLVEDEDQPLASSAAAIADIAETTGSNGRLLAAQMAIEGYEDR